MAHSTKFVAHPTTPVSSLLEENMTHLEIKTVRSALSNESEAYLLRA